MRTFFILFNIGIIIFFAQYSEAQVFTPPYANNFDFSNDTTGWRHYATTGVDDWELGVPSGTVFNSTVTAPNAWVTDLDSNFAANSVRYLETPYFNLSDTSLNYVFSFYQYRKATGANFRIQYSIGSSANWLTLYHSSARSKNWQGATGYSTGTSSIVNSVTGIQFIQGQDSVKFRFYFSSGSSNGEGWLIDNFSIVEEYFNVIGNAGDTVRVTQKCQDFTVTSVIGFTNVYADAVTTTTEYYLSADPMLDSGDSLIATLNSTISQSASRSKTIPMIAGLSSGYYYIIYKHDAANVVDETDENDNQGIAVMDVDSVFSLPYVENFENVIYPWNLTVPSSQQPVWEFGAGYRHHLEGAHSGAHAWHTSETLNYMPTNNSSQYIASPHIDLTSDTGNLILNFWFKNDMDGAFQKIRYFADCYSTSATDLATAPICRNDDWDFMNISLNSLATRKSIRFSFSFIKNSYSPEGWIVDDVYVGRRKPDLSIEREKGNRYTATNNSNFTVGYFLNNCGLAQAATSTTSFYWSADSILDGTDLLIGTKQESVLGDTVRVWTDFTFSKPTTATGKYFLFYKLDDASAIDEMREYNNIGYFLVYQQPVVVIPYTNDFESQVDGWRHNASLGSDEWQWTDPKGTVLDTAFSGIKGWITNDTGIVAAMSRMHLYTPVFDFSAAQNPVIEFDAQIDNRYYAEMNMSYSIDGGTTWKVLDTTSYSFCKWYYYFEYETYGGSDRLIRSNYSQLLFDQNELCFSGQEDYNSRDADRNTKYMLDVSFLTGVPAVQFRFNLVSSNAQLSYQNTSEGALIDNFTIREGFTDLLVPYRKSLMISSLANELTFFMDVKNQGNSLSVASTVDFYLSVDSSLGVADYFLGSSNIGAIQPDYKYLLNSKFTLPAGSAAYRYLIYKVDALSANAESNEANNIGAWDLAIDTVISYPYVNDFNVFPVDGWTWYQSNTGIYTEYRLRTQLAPGEYPNGIISGQWFSDQINRIISNINHIPVYYLESPIFNFTGFSDLDLSFDFVCIGTTYSGGQGGNLQYSTDGGNTWQVLTENYDPYAQNWYNSNSVASIDGEPGWADETSFGYFKTAMFNLSFLGGQSAVKFRFKFRSKVSTTSSSTNGFRMDNFRIDAAGVDYVANDDSLVINAALAQDYFPLTYSITNNDLGTPSPTNTKFYWSADNVLDINNDSLIANYPENAIAPGSTITKNVNIYYPAPVRQFVYYLFYIADGDDVLSENNEVNNIGSYVIQFDDTTTGPVVPPVTYCNFIGPIQAGETTNADAVSEAFCVDDEGNILLAGRFHGNANIAGQNAVSTGMNDVFLAAVSKHGEGLWAKSIFCSEQGDVKDIATDHDGNSYFIGSYDDVIDFENGMTFYGSTVAHQAYVAKLDKNGNTDWALSSYGNNNSSGDGADYGSHVAVDANGDILITGTYDALFTLGGHNLSSPTTNYSYGFVAKLNAASGSVIWAKKLYRRESAPEIITFADGSFALVGYFRSILILDNDTLYSLPRSNMTNTYVTKYDTDGNLIWNKHFTGNSSLYSVMKGKNDEFYLCGSVTDTVVIDSFTLINNAASGVYVAQLNVDGSAILAAKVIVAPSAATLSVGVDGLDVDSLGNIYLAGYLTGTANFNGLTLTNSNELFFAVKYDATLNSKWVNNFGITQYHTFTGIRHVNSVNLVAFGAFRETVDLDTVTLNTEASAFDIFLIEIDRNTGKMCVGENIDTSNTYAEVIKSNPEINVYPNPATNEINIELSEITPVIEVELMDASGRTINKLRKNGVKQFPININYANGIYFLKVYAKEMVFVKKIIVFNE